MTRANRSQSLFKESDFEQKSEKQKNDFPTLRFIQRFARVLGFLFPYSILLVFEKRRKANCVQELGTVRGEKIGIKYWTFTFVYFWSISQHRVFFKFFRTCLSFTNVNFVFGLGTQNKNAKQNVQHLKLFTCKQGFR